MQAVEQMLISICELLKDLALEEMEDCLEGFLEDIGPLIIILEKHLLLQQLVEGHLTSLFEDIT